MADEDTDSAVFGLDFAHDPAAAAVARICNAVERAIEPRKYEIFDNALAERTTHIGESNLKEYLSLARFHPAYPALLRARALSMLHIDTLILLRLFAYASALPVLEIGPYTGGSTIALCHGLRAAGRGLPLISIERGGSLPDHPDRPSSDIIADLERNVAAAGVADVVKLIAGHAREKAVVDRVAAILDGRQVGMLVVDSDGRVSEDWALYARFMAPHVILTIDDYVSDIAIEKAALVKPWVDRMVAEGRFRSLGMHGWSTWFGQLVG
jgi:predicted O-methyltransferase YrrM